MPRLEHLIRTARIISVCKLKLLPLPVIRLKFLSTPFVIDPTKKLLVQISNHSGDANNPIRGSLNATRYPSRQAYAYDYTTDTATVGNFLADLQLIMQ